MKRLCNHLRYLVMSEPFSRPLVKPMSWRMRLPKCVCHLSIQDGFSPLHVASQFGHAEITDLLMKGGANQHTLTKVCDSVIL